MNKQRTPPHRCRSTVASVLTAGVALTTFGHGASASDDFDLDAYCAASLATEIDPGPDVDFESASESDIVAAAKDYATATLRMLADNIVATAPAELTDEAAAFSELVDELAETGDFGLFETPEFAEVEATAHDYDVANCGWTVVEVVLSDYAFGGLPTELSGGPVSIELTNTGEEPHELVLFRKNEGVTLSVEELLELPEDEVGDHVEFAAAGFAEPGLSAYAVADLAPGNYVAICMLPVGGHEGGAPHAAEGMHAEFTVTG